MSFRHRYDPLLKAYIPHLTEASTAGGIYSSDIGRLVGNTTGGDLQGVSLLMGTTNTALQIIKGILVAMPSGTTGSTAGSTSATVWVQPILPGEIIEADYSTTVNRVGGTNVIGTTSIGLYFGFGGTTGAANTTTIFVGNYIDPSVASTAPGTTDGCFFRLRGFSTQNQTCWGTISSTFLAY
jgi:hypothetical protein